jgi:hypothetical protein
MARVSAVSGPDRRRLSRQARRRPARAASAAAARLVQRLGGGAGRPSRQVARPIARAVLMPTEARTRTVNWPRIERLRRRVDDAADKLRLDV